MYSIQEIKAIGLSLEKLRPTNRTEGAPLAIRSGAAQHPLQENEIRRVQGKRVPIELPARQQNTTLQFF